MAGHFNRTTCFLIGFLLIGSIHVSAQEKTSKVYKQTDPSKSFAVVELFTSQGCSSCPPADSLLRDVTKAARESNARIFTLSFHVDYWNDLGWTDPYSDKKYTKRQRVYARTNKERKVYTPQMIINGNMAFAGYDLGRLEQSIDRGLRSPAQTPLLLAVKNWNQNLRVVELGYVVKKHPKNSILQIAVVQQTAINLVERGENTGRKSWHSNIVRQFKTIPLEASTGTVLVTIPKDIDLTHTSIFAFVQNRKTMSILGANGFDLAGELN